MFKIHKGFDHKQAAACLDKLTAIENTWGLCDAPNGQQVQLYCAQEVASGGSGNQK